MIKPTASAWIASLQQMVRADLLQADQTKALEAKGFRKVEGAPDIWEYHGTRKEAEATADQVLGSGKVKAWWEAPGKAYKPGTPLWSIIEDGLHQLHPSPQGPGPTRGRRLMNYTITMIEHIEKQTLRDHLKHTYDLPEPPAGSWSLQSVGSQTIVTFHRSIGDDAGVLEAYGEPMDSATTIRQLRFELLTAVGNLDSSDSHEAKVAQTLKSLASSLTRNNCAVQGVEEAALPYNMSTGLAVRGDDGMRVYVAVMPNREVELIRAKTVDEAESWLSQPCDSIHFIGMLGGGLS